MNNHTRHVSWITIAQAALLVGIAGLTGYVLFSGNIEAAARAQGPGGFGGFGGERKIVAEFDKNGDKRLDNAERKAAREAMTSESGARGFGRRGGGPGGFGRGGIVPGTPGPKIAPADVKSYPNAPLYDIATLRTIFLQFENADWEKELAAFNNTDVEVPAIATVDGKVYENVGVHFRGASSYMMVPEGSKRSLNLTFDFVDEKQTLNGYRTLNLLNANGDPTLVRTIVYSEISQHYIPAPKANYMRVVINGESWGVYVNAQQFNKDFTRDYFQSTKGARWKVPGRPGGRGGMEYLGDDPAAYKGTYEIKTKDDAKSWADLIRMFRVLNETPADTLEAALAPMLDIDGALKFLALDVALVNSDGYWTRASDYSIYQDERGRFHVIPHDMNEGLTDEGGRGFGPPPGFGPDGPPPGFGRGGPPDGPGPAGPGGPGGRRGGGGRGMFGGGGADLDPLVGLDDTTKPLRSKLLAVPALRQRYLAYVREIAEKHLDWNTLGPRIAKYQALIAADVKTDTRKLYSTEAFTTGTTGDTGSLEAFVVKRREFLLK